MQKKLELIKFTLTQSMALELIKFNSLKHQLLEKKKLCNLDKNKKLLLEIKRLEDELSCSKIKFIKEFRENNQEQIKEYLSIKDQF